MVSDVCFLVGLALILLGLSWLIWCYPPMGLLVVGIGLTFYGLWAHKEVGHGQADQ